MERCKFCGEVLEYNSQYCPVCGKSTKKEPSKRFLKKKAKEDAFEVNYDARLYRVSYRVFGVIFLLLSLITFAFYGQYLFVALGKLDIAQKFIDGVDKVFGINTKVNKALPFIVVGQSKVSFLLVFYGVALLLSICSLFTKKRASLGATTYKLSAIISIGYMIFNMLLLSFLSNVNITEMVEKIVTYVCAGLSLLFFIIGFIASFNFKNPYRATWYQGFKALCFMILTVLSALAILLNDQPEILSDVMKYVMYNPPIYTFIASILLFIGSKYRGNIEKLV